MDAASPHRRLMLLAPWLALAEARAAEPSLHALILDTEPFGYRNAAGEVVGLYVHLMRLLTVRAGLAAQVDIAPIARVVHQVNLGTTDVTLLLPFHFEPGVRAIGVALQLELMLLPRRGLVLTRPEDLARLNVVCFRGTSALGVLPQGVALNVQEVSSARIMVSMVKAGRADVVLGVRETLISGLRAAGLRGDADDGFGPPLSLGHLDVSLWVRPELPAATVEALARGLKGLQQSGEITRLRQHYFGDARLPLTDPPARRR
jgi:polar amino acid transport system substrate-binding protein